MAIILGERPASAAVDFGPPVLTASGVLRGIITVPPRSVPVR
jgi:hypothetical protein